MAVFAGNINQLKASSFVKEQTYNKPFEQEHLPEALKGWDKWVMDGVLSDNCRYSYNNKNKQFCFFLSELSLDISPKSLEFTQNVTLLADGYVQIPGSVGSFPVKATVNNKDFPIILKGGKAYVNLEQGKYTIVGQIKSMEEIRNVIVPENAAILNVYKLGVEVKNPTVDNGVLRLETKSTARGETDDLTVFVYRKIYDDIPLSMNVHLSLNVTGKERVENLGKIIPENFALVSINSNLSTYVHKNGDLMVEVKPGNNIVDISLRQISPSLDLKLDNSPVEQEIWVFENDDTRRVIQVPVMLRSVQAQNTSLPQAWKRLPAYEVSKGNKFTLKAIPFDKNRPDSLRLQRDIKLAFAGDLYSISDNISGTFYDDERLSVVSPLTFYSSSINGEPQAITSTKDNPDSGIEIRKGSANIQNILRVENSNKNIPAAGYNKIFDSVTWNLQLAPGYKLFYASGADSVSNSWISNWNLMSVFLVALLTVSVYHLFGFWKALVAAGAFVLICPVFFAFIAISFIICGVIFIQRHIEEDKKVQKFLSFIKYSLCLFLLIASFAFAVNHLRQAMYPGLESVSMTFLMNFIDYRFLAIFYLVSVVVYMFYNVYKNPQRSMTRKVVYTILFFLFIGFSGIVSIAGYFLSYGYFPDRYDTFYEESVDTFRSSSVKEVAYAAPSVAKMKSSSLLDKGYAKYQSLNAIKNIAQTGVGFPSWTDYKNKSTLYINGPVDSGDIFSLYLISPTINVILSFMRVILGFVVLYWLLDKRVIMRNINLKNISQKLAVLAFVFLLFNPLSARAEAGSIPSDSMLKELETKLNRNYIPSCIPDCISIPEASLTQSNKELVLSFKVYSNDDNLVLPLPTIKSAGVGYAKLQKLIKNGVNADIVSENNILYVPIDKNTNIFELYYELDDSSNSFIFSSYIPINYIETNLSDFSLSAMGDNNQKLQNFQINRVKKNEDSVIVQEKEEVSRLEPETYFIVYRTFDISSIWEVKTKIVRINNLTEVSSFNLPTLSGEKILTTDGVLLKDGVRLSFSPNEKEKELVSIVPVEQDITLKSPQATMGYKEIWKFKIDNIWSFKYDGVTQSSSNNQYITFNPYYGEVLNMSIVAPNSVDGYVVTIDDVNQDTSLGRDVLETNISLKLRASESGVHDIVLPENTSIKSLTVGGKTYPITINDNVFTIPVVQGVNNISFTAETKEAIGNVISIPEYDLNAPMVDIKQSVKVPYKKWILYIDGPVKGTAVLFWSMLPVWLIAALALSCFKFMPLKFIHWFVLLLGLSQTSLIFTIIIVLWFALIGLKSKLGAKSSIEKILQVAIPLLTLAFIYSLFRGVYSGLLGNWNMNIQGYRSYLSSGFANLGWYQDISMGKLPTPKVFTLPIAIYRTIMVLWSIWLSVYFVRWARWGFAIYNNENK